MQSLASTVMRPLLLALSLALLASTASADVRELIGRPAPDLRARQLDSDDTVQLSSYRGRVVLLAFFATWCSACRHMAPELEALQREHGAEGFDVLAFSNEPRNRLAAHSRVDPRAYSRLQCTSATSLRFEARALPTIVLVDREGIVRAGYHGAAPGTVQRIRRDIGRLLAN
jgi:thiol-disulfide isomerase/thioredoxin